MTRAAPLPSMWRLYARVLASRKPRWVPEGVPGPRLDGRLDEVSVDPQHLQAYRQVCGWGDGTELPPTYPHVLAARLHLDMLSSSAFPVRLMGLVHLANRCEVLTPLTASSRGALIAWLEGYQKTERGQVFELHSEWRDGQALLWKETTTFLARAQASGLKRAPVERASAPPSGRRVDVPAGIGRRYGPIGGDMNPIHLSDATARLFGFKAAIAHGMWSLARCAFELGAMGPGVLTAQFKLPIFVPAVTTLEQKPADDGHDFSLADAGDGRPHVVGRWAPRR